MPETALSDSIIRETLASILEGAQRPVFVKDECSRFVFLNDAACRLMGGISPCEAIGRSVHDFLPKAEADAIRAKDVQIFATKAEELFEEQVTGPTGTRRTQITHKRVVSLPAGGTTANFLVVEINDVTELRTAERVLRESEEHHRSFIELHPQTPWVADAEGEIIEVGRQWTNLSGRSVDDAAGRGWEHSVHPDDLELVMSLWQASVRTGQLLDVEFRVLTAAGGYRWFRSRAAPKRSATGAIVRWYGLLEEVHERQLALQALRQSEQKLREHRDQLEKLVEVRTAEVQQKNAELDRLLQQEREANALQRRFVAMISHEFRTPLAIIDSAAQRLTRTKSAVTSEYLAEKSNQIKGAVARMVELMESILAAGRLQSGTIEITKTETSLSALVLECADKRQQISGTHHFHLDLDSLPGKLDLDPVAFERVFANLFSNAVKYAPHAPDVYVRGWQEDGLAKMSVRDGGIGMDAEDLPRLFQPYFRARSATGIAGTGIGLNIVKEIVELHGGCIIVDSVIGAGTIFTIHLPMDETQALIEAA
ncbi:sensor histidine kinase [Rhizobium halophilum]|uniref:sensor histidine kinase n=1 Tax=Rhizobium halophilum TaxID=2846852 RepID=UPI001EFDE5A5|nr:ATP-binding protein [Rhizobium halophilum]MCF6368127.1 PAS domain S-box protein [Rhizobium halophilum]